MIEQDDAMGVLTTTRYVVEHSRHVSIDRERIQSVAADLARSPVPIPAWNLRYHFADGTPQTANYVLVLDALNFSFWGEPRWQVEFLGELVNGYWALAAALKRALALNIPILDARFLASLSRKQLAEILKGHGEVPMLDERLANLREAGQVLVERYHGELVNAIVEAQRSAVGLVQLLAHELPSFNDVVVYDGREVRLYKRAQILVGDLHGAYFGQGWGHFPDLDQLTAFADYKVPQVLRRLGILRYSPQLSGRLCRRECLAPGSPEEVEIRANTIWGVEELRQALLRLGVKRNSFELDWLLWELGQTPSPDDEPYHRTRTIFY
ncbi:MAG: hypothetical protein HYY04_10300 [Chloroflexi bacterium]|nr:hypothetical protein [Chloroflexota bacterium]